MSDYAKSARKIRRMAGCFFAVATLAILVGVWFILAGYAPHGLICAAGGVSIVVSGLSLISTARSLDYLAYKQARS